MRASGAQSVSCPRTASHASTVQTLTSPLISSWLHNLSPIVAPAGDQISAVLSPPSRARWAGQQRRGGAEGLSVISDVTAAAEAAAASVQRSDTVHNIKEQSIPSRLRIKARS